MRYLYSASITFSITILTSLACITGSAHAQTPQAISTSPSAQTITATVGTDIVITFDTPLNAATVTTSSFRVFGRWSGPASGAFIFEDGNATIRFTPDEPFFYGEWVTVALSHDITSSGGQALQTGYAWNFWTRTLKGTLEMEEIKRIPVRMPGEDAIQTYGAYAGDLNDDGWTDLSLPNEISNDFRVFYNDGNGDYSNFDIYPMPGMNRPSTNEGADFDQDGYIDLAIGSAGNNKMAVQFGDGAGGFLAPTNNTAGSSVRGLAIIDLDTDGFDDIVTANRNSSTISIFMNNGDRTFATAINMDAEAGGETAIAAADANNDGILDLFVGARTSGEMALLLGDGSGGLTFSSKVSAGGPCWMIAIGDLNGDGNVDVVSANSTGNTGSVLFGDGSGGMSAPTIFPTGAFSIAIDLGDLDGDGDLDLVTSNYTGNDWTLYENDGAGNFSNVRSFPASGAGSCCIFHDRDNDGDLDMTGIDEIDDLIFLFDNNYRAVRFSADTTIGQPPLPVQFSSETDQTVVEWLWDFGDGSTDSVESPLHTYTQPGLYTVSATITTVDTQYTEITADFVGVYADSLIPLPVNGLPGQLIKVPVYARNYLTLAFVTIPFSWSGELDLAFGNISNAGLRSSAMTGNLTSFDPFGKTGSYTMFATPENYLEPGSGPIAEITFSLPGVYSPDTGVVTIESNASSYPTFVSVLGTYIPETFAAAITLSCCTFPGDANNSGSNNIADATFIISYIFSGGPTPDCLDQADANGSNSINISDATYLIAYIFSGGALPVCGTTGS